jgi:molybdopterin/thiamine biosynthesis adenylyltransferase
MLVERPGERLQEHNLVRHLLGYRSLGKLKLDEVARFLKGLNPRVRVANRPLDVVEEKAEFSRLLSQWHPNLIAVCTDNEPSKHAINQAAVNQGIPQVGAGVYDGGIGGEIYRVLPGEACYGCIADHLQLSRSKVLPPPRPNYNAAEPVETPSVSALGLDIEQIALLQCRMILETLFQDRPLTGLGPEVNLCVFANRLVPETFPRPWHGEFFHIPAREDCLDCGAAPRSVEADAKKILAELAGRDRN